MTNLKDKKNIEEALTVYTAVNGLTCISADSSTQSSTLTGWSVMQTITGRCSA